MSVATISSFAVLLRRHRLAAGLTQEELAERAHLSLRAVSALEQGVNRAPRKDTVALLVEALTLAEPERLALECAARGRQGAASAQAADHGASGGTGMRPPLVGRARELALLERHLTGEGPPVLLLAGEPGIGKSRLLREAAVRAPAHGMIVLEGGCQRRGGQDPFAPLLDALASHLAQQTGAARRSALQGCAWLARLLPELAGSFDEPVPEWRLGPEQERRLIVSAVSRYLANSAGLNGALLLLDDLQWAGNDALEMLSALLRVRSGTPVRVIAAYRDTETPRDGALATLAADLAHAGLAWHRTLVTLPLDDARQLLQQQLEGSSHADTALREQLLRRTGGLPFFLVSCAQALRQGEGGADVVPWDLSASIRQRLAALSLSARNCLGVAAVIGRTVSLDLLAAVTERPETEVVEALEEACRARLLIEEGVTAYRFAHDVIREVCEAELSAARRALLHRRIAELLESTAGELPLEALAYHFGQAEAPERALHYMELAGDHAWARHAPAAAEAHFQALVQRFQQLGRDRDMARICEKLGRILTTVARYGEAVTMLERSAVVYGAEGDLERLGWLTACIGHAYRCMPAPEAGLERIWPVLAKLEAGEPSYGLAALYATLAHLWFATGGGYDNQLAAATRAAELARLVGADHLLVDAEESWGSALIMMGRIDEGVGIVEAAIPRAAALRDQDERGLLSSQEVLGLLHWRIAKVHCARGEWEQARDRAGSAHEALSRLGAASTVIGPIGTFVSIDFYAGDWASAWKCATVEEEIEREIGRSWASPYILLDRAQLHLAEGRHDEAASLCSRP